MVLISHKYKFIYIKTKKQAVQQLKIFLLDFV